MTRYQTPGVYFEWLNASSNALMLQRTDITGFVGICQRGALQSPQKIESWPQFTSIFGGCIPEAYLAYAVRGFFANGGRTCWVVRAADPQAARCAWGNLRDAHGAIALSLRARGEGTWAHRMEAVVLRGGLERFTLTLRLPDGSQELWRDLTLETAEKRLNDAANGSRLVEAFRVNDGAPVAGQGAGRTIQSGRYGFRNGRDGLADLLPGHLTGNIAALDAAEGVKWGLALLEDIAEISILAIPDAMTKDVSAGQRYTPPPRCDVIVDEEDATAGETPEGASAGPSVGAKGSITPQDLAAMEEDLARREQIADVLEAQVVRLSIRFGQTRALPSSPLGVQFEAAKRAAAQALADAELQADEVRQAREELGLLVEEPAAPDEYPPAFDEDEINEVQWRMVLQCETQKNRVAVLDLPRPVMMPTAAIDWAHRFDSTYAAIYYPWLRVQDANEPPGALRSIPPSGHVAGVYARVDKVFGVHKPPANELLALVQDLSMPVDDVIHGLLNEAQVNALRAYPGRGLRVAGARTLSSDSMWLYVNVRRLLIMIERSIDAGTQWMPFEPNNFRMWRDTERVISSFLDTIWRLGMLDGAKATDAYQVRCDDTTNPPAETDQGRLLCLVGVQPPQPAEYVVVRIGRTESGSTVLEG